MVNLLLIEDSEADAKLVRKCLSEAGRPDFVVKRVDRLSAALGHLEEETPDVILLDLSLPDSLWYQTFEALRDKTAHIPIVILTGTRHETHPAETIRHGAQDYLIKGEMEPRTFTRTILHAIERQKAQNDLRGLNSKIQRNLTEGEKLIRFSQAINAAGQFEELSKLLEITIPNLFQMETFSLFLIEEETRVLKLLSHNHAEWKDLKSPFVIPEDDGLMWHAVKLGNPIHLDRFSMSRFASRAERKRYEKDSAVILPLTAKNIPLGVLNLNDPLEQGLSESNLANIIRVSHHLSLAIYNMNLLRRIENLTVTDELTQIHNRRYLWQGLYREMEAYERHRRPFSILMIDLDHFKRVNDLYGHTAGDRVLKKTSEFLAAQLRSVDFLCRFGGEEFIAVLSDTSGESALNLAERIRRNYAAQKILIDKDRVLNMTISVGVAECSKKEKVTDLIDRADHSLYEAKKSGRNRCSFKKII